MGASRRLVSVLFPVARYFQVAALLLLCAAQSSVAQAPAKKGAKPAVRRAPPVMAPAIVEAEDAIAKQDYARAELLLKAVVERDSKDFRGWYDLAFVFKATQRPDEAVLAYKAALAANPGLHEANLDLGELLMAVGRSTEATPYLRSAAEHKPSETTLLLLGRSLESTDPKSATVAYERAAAMAPQDPAPLLRLAQLAERNKDHVRAEAQYKAVLGIDPTSVDAMAGLVNIYLATERLPEAETAIRDFIALDPRNTQARIQLGRILAKNGRADAAITELEAGIGEHPDPALLRELADAYFAGKKYEKAVSSYQAILKDFPEDADVRFGLGSSLMHLTRYAEAEPHLLVAVRQAPQMAEAYANLALTASNLKKYELAIKALDVRAKLTPDVPATLFLRATCYDNLRLYKQAVENYKAFLAAAEGKFPDQEWQAKHRLIAIEPKAKK
jgi:tetratricopeptide (TPR) repeat protein